METGYQRGRIQDESMLYEHRKHDGTLPHHRRQHLPATPSRRAAGRDLELARGTEDEKQSQLDRAARLPGAAPRRGARRAAPPAGTPRGTASNVFAVLMDAARVCSPAQITEAFFEVGGQYRRNV